MYLYILTLDYTTLRKNLNPKSYTLNPKKSQKRGSVTQALCRMFPVQGWDGLGI